MLSAHRQCTLILAGFVILATATAEDLQNGKNLLNAQCTQCHIKLSGGDGSGIFTRKDHRVTSLPGLIRQVDRCKASIGVTWTEAQTADVVAYLDSTYYHFKSGK